MRSCQQLGLHKVTDPRGRVPQWHRMCPVHAKDWADEFGVQYVPDLRPDGWADRQGRETAAERTEREAADSRGTAKALERSPGARKGLTRLPKSASVQTPASAPVEATIMGWTPKQCQDAAETAILGTVKDAWGVWGDLEHDVLAYLHHTAPEAVSGRAADAWRTVIQDARRALRKSGLIDYQSVRVPHTSGREVLAGEWRRTPPPFSPEERSNALAQWAAEDRAIVAEVERLSETDPTFAEDIQKAAAECGEGSSVGEITRTPVLPGGGGPILTEFRPLRDDGSFAVPGPFPVPMPAPEPEPLPAPGTAEAIEAARVLLEDAMSRLDILGPLQAALDVVEQYNRLAPVICVHREMVGDQRPILLPLSGVGSARGLTQALRDAVKMLERSAVVAPAAPVPDPTRTQTPQASFPSTVPWP